MNIKCIPVSTLKVGNLFRLGLHENEVYKVIEVTNYALLFYNPRTNGRAMLYNMNRMCYIEQTKIYPQRKRL